MLQLLVALVMKCDIGGGLLNNSHRGTGAAVGAAIGAAVGGTAGNLIGKHMDKFALLFRVAF